MQPLLLIELNFPQLLWYKCAPFLADYRQPVGRLRLLRLKRRSTTCTAAVIEQIGFWEKFDE